jgi:hypothetical protein
MISISYLDAICSSILLVHMISISSLGDVMVGSGVGGLGQVVWAKSRADLGGSPMPPHRSSSFSGRAESGGGSLLLCRRLSRSWPWPSVEVRATDPAGFQQVA